MRVVYNAADTRQPEKAAHVRLEAYNQAARTTQSLKNLRALSKGGKV